MSYTLRHEKFEHLYGTKVHSDLGDFEAIIIDVNDGYEFNFVIQKIENGTKWLRTPSEIGMKDLKIN